MGYKPKKSPIVIPEKYIRAININGMNGRLMIIPAKKKSKANKKWLLVYGHHSSLERMYSVAQYMSNYGEVIVPDLPGFGGMDSFYKIGSKPSFENLAGYLNSIIKLYIRNGKFSVFSMSFGFLVVTKMLQLYPSLTKRIEKNASLVGFGSHKDFEFQGLRIKLGRMLARILATGPGSKLVRITLLNKISLNFLLKHFLHKRSKFKHLKESEIKDTIDMERELWMINDPRTHFHTLLDMMSLDFTSQKIDLKLLNIASKNDQWFNSKSVKKSLAAIYKNLTTDIANMETHGASVVATEKEVEKMLPKKAKEYLVR